MRYRFSKRTSNTLDKVTNLASFAAARNAADLIGRLKLALRGLDTGG